MIIIVAAIAGPLWLSTEEKIPWLAVNTSYYRSNYTVSYIVKSSNASLWILCTRQGSLSLLFLSKNFLLSITNYYKNRHDLFEVKSQHQKKKNSKLTIQWTCFATTKKLRNFSVQSTQPRMFYTNKSNLLVLNLKTIFPVR